MALLTLAVAPLALVVSQSPRLAAAAEESSILASTHPKRHVTFGASRDPLTDMRSGFVAPKMRTRPGMTWPPPTTLHQNREKRWE